MNKFRSVMLIDDDETTNFLNKRTVQQTLNPSQILIANDGKTALAMLQECYEQFEKTGSSFIPDLILLDINMPVMDGFSFLEAFNQLQKFKDKEILLVVLTTSLYYRDLERARNAGITRFLNKPLTSLALLQLYDKS